MLQETMLKVQAWERLNNPEYSGQLDMEQFRRLLLDAGYSVEVADKASVKRGWDRLDAGVTM